LTSDIKDSIKARLYDMKYTPFMASFMFAWIFYNAKSILIFFTNKLSILEKIDMLSYSNIEYLNPLYFGLFYTILFPIFSALFYYITLQYKRLMNKIKQKIQDETPLPQEEANKIINENLELELELNSKISEINKIKSNFENKIEDYNKKEKELENSFDTKLTEEITLLTDKNNKLLDDIEEKHKIIQEQNEKIVILENKINKKSTANSSNIISDDELKLLQIIYDNNIKKMSTNDYKNKIVSTNKFKEIKVQHLIDNLIKKNIMIQTKDSFRSYYDITPNGRKIILDEFDKET
jgi:hypothetical protein